MKEQVRSSQNKIDIIINDTIKPEMVANDIIGCNIIRIRKEAKGYSHFTKRKYK